MAAQLGVNPTRAQLEALTSQPEALAKVLRAFAQGRSDEATADLARLVKETEHRHGCCDASPQAQWDETGAAPLCCAASDDEGAPARRTRRRKDLRPREASDVALDGAAGALKPLAMMKAPRCRRKKKDRDANTNAGRIRKAIREHQRREQAPSGAEPAAEAEPAPPPPPPRAPTAVEWVGRVYVALGRTRLMVLLTAALFVVELTAWARWLRDRVEA